MSLLMCHGDSPQQQALRGMSWEEYFTKPEVSECQLLQFFHLYNGETHRDPTAEAGAIPEAENWSCGEPFPASKLTLLKTEQLIIHTYTPMVHFCTAHCFLLGVGALLEALLPCFVNRTNSIYLSLCLEMNSCCHWLQQSLSVTIFWLLWRELISFPS